jgi:hypothetical protein
MVLLKQFVVGFGVSLGVSYGILVSLTDRRYLAYSAYEMDESQFVKTKYDAVRRFIIGPPRCGVS